MKTNVLIIGAGINGVLTAYFLVENGVKDIVLIDEHYPGSGGTFRCATGIRASFTSVEHVEAMKRSIELWSILSKRHGFQYERSGYLWMFSREEDLELFRRIVDFHHKHGIPTRVVDVDEIRRIVPTINAEGLVGGVYDPLAGKADNFHSLLKIYTYLIQHGVKTYSGVKALKIIAEHDRVKGVETNKGLIEAEKVVVTAGYGSRELLETAGVSIQTRNVPKHALITEAYKELFKPLLIDWSSSSYMVQVFHGGFLIGAEIEEEPDKPHMNRIEYLFNAVKIWSKYFKWLPETHLLRYWTGYYVMTPDHHPIIGPVSPYQNLYTATGFSGHGFMMAPASSEALAEYIIYGEPKHSIMNRFRLERFEKGELIKEIAVFG